ncbi:MAG: Flp pilus assembly complex ATPase component TadA [DPANN group archaeon]|nr:Flp pilus assembly complex ATPase component TadA [DPANN group archaeon]
MLYNLKEIVSEGDLCVLSGFFTDDNIEEIMHDGVLGCVKIYHAQFGMCETNVQLSSEAVDQIINNVVAFNGKVLSSSMPLFDGILFDGSRINIVLAPIAVNGPAITIRKFKKQVMTAGDLVNSGVMNSEVCAFLWCCLDGLSHKPANILFSGGTSSGKTTLLNAVSMFIPSRARIVTIEDTPELRLPFSNIVRLETSFEPLIDMDMLLRNTLRMRPDRIIVGEVRGPECKSLFTAMNTGHEGCMGTIHANDARETIEKVVNPPMEVPPVMLKALDLIVMVSRKNIGGTIIRVITEISEMGGVENGVPRLNTIYTFDPNKGELRRTGVPSKIRTKIADACGMAPADFDKILRERTGVIDNLCRLRLDVSGFKKAVDEGNGI